MSQDKVLGAVEDLLPTLRDRARQTDETGAIPPESIEALRQTGFFRLLLPRSRGGLEADPVAFYTAVQRLAGVCGSTGWVGAVLGVHLWNVALFDPRAQDDVLSTDALVCSSYGLMGTATPVEGGYRLRGRWSFASGSDYASWVLLGAKVVDAGAPVAAGTFLLPLADCAVEHVWDAIGLRGTASNDVVAEDVFVPAHRMLDADAVQKCAVPGHAVNDGPLYRLPFGPVHTTTISACIVGMAYGAHDAFVEYQRQRVRVAVPGEATREKGFAGDAFAEDPFTAVRLAETSSDIDAAWLQLTHNIQALHDCARAGEPVSPVLRLRARRDQVRATQRALDAVEQLFQNSGGRALIGSPPVQRFWRDAHAARAHAANDPERVYKMYGTAVLGQRP